jgi:hypothetical protein
MLIHQRMSLVELAACMGASLEAARTMRRPSVTVEALLAAADDALPVCAGMPSGPHAGFRHDKDTPPTSRRNQSGRSCRRRVSAAPAEGQERPQECPTRWFHRKDSEGGAMLIHQRMSLVELAACMGASLEAARTMRLLLLDCYPGMDTEEVPRDTWDVLLDLSLSEEGAGEQAAVGSRCAGVTTGQAGSDEVCDAAARRAGGVPGSVQAGFG